MQIKDCFTSRYGDNGVIVEIDYSQLEVIGAAIVSGDPMMAEDILNGIDSHSQSASWLNPYTYKEIKEGYEAEIPLFVKMRKAAKSPRFELQYGAGATSIATNNGISVEKAKGFIEQYYARYSVLKDFQDAIAAEVEANKFKTGKHTRHGYPIHGGTWKSATGRVYYFEETESPDFMHRKGKYTSFTPTKFKNYPMQGFATGDIVPEMLGRVNNYCNRHRSEDQPPLLINTVHDSMLFDMSKDTYREHIASLTSLMQSVPAVLEGVWGIHTDLPFDVGAEVGSSWGSVSNYKEEV